MANAAATMRVNRPERQQDAAEEFQRADGIGPGQRIGPAEIDEIARGRDGVGAEQLGEAMRDQDQAERDTDQCVGERRERLVEAGAAAGTNSFLRSISISDVVPLLSSRSKGCHRMSLVVRSLASPTRLPCRATARNRGSADPGLR